MSSPTTVPAAADPARIERRLLALTQDAIEERRELSDVLGDAFQELRLARAGIRALQAEVRQKEAAIRALQAGSADGDHGSAAPVADSEEVGETVAGESARPRAGPAGGSAGWPDLLDGVQADGAEPLEASLRAAICGALYLGAVGPGGRLPGIRETARRTGVNHKVVRRIFRLLERERLVQVRDRSGIYAAEASSPVDGALGPMEAWVARVLVEAGDRGLPPAELAGLLRRWTGSRRLRCACVESTEDDRFALGREIGERFGLETVAVDAATADLAAALGSADLVVTTSYHAGAVRAVLPAERPLVVADRHPRLLESLERLRGGGPRAIFCVDAAAGTRLLQGLSRHEGPPIRVVAMGDGPPPASPEEYGTTLVTRAAWERLGREEDGPETAVPPYLSPRTALEIACLVVRLNRAAAD